MKKQEILNTLNELKQSKFMAMQTENNAQKWAKLSADFQRLMRCINSIEKVEFSELQNISTQKPEK